MANFQLLQLTRHQFGTVHRAQLVEDLSLTRSQIAGLRKGGELIEVLPSTYRLASHPDTFLSRALATQLWAGGVGFLSSWFAARVFELRKMPTDTIDFTAPIGFSRRTAQWVHLDRTSWYSESDRRRLTTGLTARSSSKPPPPDPNHIFVRSGSPSVLDRTKNRRDSDCRRIPHSTT